MAKHTETGIYGEKLAVKYLLSKAYDILETNWRFGHKEIDIIAQLNNEIVFVEVKTRRNVVHEKPYEAVTQKKQELLIDAAEAYLNETESDLEVRFDIISISLNKNLPEIDHIKSAFNPQF